MGSRAKRASLALSGNAVNAAGLLARNIFLARLLPLEDYGLAATLMILMALAETAQDAGMNRLIVQSDRGDDPDYQASLHGVQAQFGLAAGVIALLLAPAFAMLVGDARAPAGDYALVALLASLTGFVHLDVWRRQRAGAFQPYALYQALPALAGLAAIYPLFLWLGDYRVAIGMIAVSQATRLLVSHGLAQRGWRLAHDKATARAARQFALPLLCNGLLLFLAFNGDRLIVANRLGLETLGWFSAAFLLCLTPANLAANTMRSLMLPALSTVKADEAAFAQRAREVVEIAMILALGLLGGVLIFGPLMIRHLFGEGFTPATALLAPLAVAQGLRVVRSGATIAAMAQARTINPFLSNVMRCLFLPAGFVAASTGPDPAQGLMILVLMTVMAELSALAVALFLLGRKRTIRARDLLISGGLAVGAGLVALAPALSGARLGDAFVAFAALALAAIASLETTKRRWRGRGPRIAPARGAP